MRINFIKSEKPVCSGGPTTIVAWAGKDASKFFNEIHKGVKSPGFALHVSNVSVIFERLEPVVFWMVKYGMNMANVGKYTIHGIHGWYG